MKAYIYVGRSQRWITGIYSRKPDGSIYLVNLSSDGAEARAFTPSEIEELEIFYGRGKVGAVTIRMVAGD